MAFNTALVAWCPYYKRQNEKSCFAISTKTKVRLRCSSSVVEEANRRVSFQQRPGNVLFFLQKVWMTCCIPANKVCCVYKSQLLRIDAKQKIIIEMDSPPSPTEVFITSFYNFSTPKASIPKAQNKNPHKSFSLASILGKNPTCSW